MKNKYVPFFTMLNFILLACSSEEKGLAELRRLCEKDAGLTVNKTVEADGYYDATRTGGVLRLLIPSDFSFSEYCESEPNIASLFQEPGCWRLTKISRESASCNETIDNILHRYDVKGYSEFKDEHCIAVEKIDKPTAMYSYHSSPKAWTDENGTSEFRRSDSYIKDSTTSEVVGRYVSYSYNARPGLSAPKSCHVIDEQYVSYAEANLISSVIKPVKEK